MVSEKFKQRTGDILNFVLHESCPQNCDIPPGLLQVCDEVLLCYYLVRLKSSPTGQGIISLPVNHHVNLLGFNSEGTLNASISLFRCLTLASLC